MKYSVWLGIILSFQSVGWAGPFGIIDKIQEIRASVYLGTGYKAQTLCSNVFLSGKPANQVLDEDTIDPDGQLGRLDWWVDQNNGTATSQFSLLRTVTRQSVYLGPNLGCVLNYGNYPLLHFRYQGSFAPDSWASQTANPPSDSWDRSRLKSAVDWTFQSQHAKGITRTKALVVLQHGKLVAEQYAPGVTASTKLLGWSISKSVTTTLIGILSHEGKLDVDKPIPVPEWQGQGDPRREITWNYLLHMLSGLGFEDNYWDTFNEANLMLYEAPDMGAYVAQFPQRYTRGTHWAYSSGGFNLMSRALRTYFSSEEQYLKFPYDALFAKLGMSSAAFETDASGTYVGSSSVYASARDWAKFGQFLLQDGQWNGETLLTPGWMKWACSSSSVVPQGKYGAGFWTNGLAGMRDADRPWPNLPADACLANGFKGQEILLIPSKDLVLVRLGSDPNDDVFDEDDFGKVFLNALKN